MWAIIAFLVISVGYFSPEIFEKKTVLGHDSRQGTTQEVDSYRKETGKSARWTNSMFSGMPTYQVSPAYDTAKFIQYLSKAYSLGLPAPVSYVFMLMVGFYILVCVMGARSSIATLGAIGYAFSSYFFIIIMAGHIWKVLALAFIPPTIAGLILTYRGKYIAGGLTTAIFLAFQIWSNHIQMTYYSCFIMGAYVLWVLVEAVRKKEVKDFIKSTGVCIAAVILAVSVNLSNLYHTWEYSRESMRGKSELTLGNSEKAQNGLDLDYMTQWSYGIGETWSLLIPDVKGGGSGYIGNEVAKEVPAQYRQIVAQQNHYWGNQPFTSGPVYAGAFFMTLFVLAFFIVPGKLKWYLLGATIITTFLSWGHNMMWFTELFADYFPMYSKFRSVSSILVVAELVIPLLAALCVVEIAKDPEVLKRKYKGVITAFALTGGIALMFAIAPRLFFNFLSEQEAAYFLPQVATNAQLAPIIDAIEEARISIFTDDAWRTFFIITIGMVVLGLYVLKKIKTSIFIGGLIVICLVDMWGVDKRYLNSDHFITRKETKDFASFYRKSQADQKILQDKDLYFRVYNLSVNTFNDGATSFYHKSIGGYHAAKLGRYQELIEHQISKQNMEVLNMLNAKYFIIPDENNRPQAQLNPEALGNGWFVDEIKWVDNANEEMKALNDFDPAKTVIIDRRFASIFDGKTATQDSSATIRLTKYLPDELHYTVSSQKGGIAVFSDIYYPHGWVATIDGAETAIARANYVLRAMYIPAGEHSVVMTFHPKSVTITEIIGWCGFVLFALILLGALLYHIKSHKCRK